MLDRRRFDNRARISAELNDLIDKLESITSQRLYIYRGESRDYGVISSMLYRYYEATSFYSPTNHVKLHQKIENLKSIAIDAGVTNYKHGNFADFSKRRLCGGINNLIDFTRDWHIALFFAIRDDPALDGRMIFLDRDYYTSNTDNEILDVTELPELSRPQQSVMLDPGNGFIDLDNNHTTVVAVPRTLKKEIKIWLSDQYDVNEKHLFPEGSNFEQYQSEGHDFVLNYHKVLCEYRNKKFNNAMEGFTRLIREYEPDLTPKAYFYRGIANYMLNHKDAAVSDFMKIRGVVDTDTKLESLKSIIGRNICQEELERKLREMCLSHAI